MNKLLFLISFSLLLIIGCQDDNSILEPNEEFASKELSKGRPILSLDSDNLKLTDELDDSDFTEDLDTEIKPALSKKEKVSAAYFDDHKVTEDSDWNFDIDYDVTTKKFSFVTKNFTVDGSKGDELRISETYLKEGKLISMSAKLTIPQDAFKGILNFDIIFDFDNYSVELYPSPFTFDNPVSLDLSFFGIDFTNIEVDKLDFNYLDGEKELLNYADININESWGLLSIKGAQLSHFSRYGWTRTTTIK